MAKRVGPSGKVYANDLQPQMLGLLRNNAARGGITNVETVLGSETDPKLPPGQIDLIILVDVYHEFSQPQKMLQGIRRALKGRRAAGAAGIPQGRPKYPHPR